MTLTFAPDTGDTIPLYVTERDGLEDLLKDLPSADSNWIKSQGFEAGLGQSVTVPDADGNLKCAVFGLGRAASRSRQRFHFARAARDLPKGSYHLVSSLGAADLNEAALGWLLAGYAFDRYRAQPKPSAQLVCQKGVDAARIEVIAAGEALTRDLINTPASDMGPAELEAAARELATTHGADIAVIEGDALLDQNFPMIHTVGRASHRAPRLIDMSWGDTGPKLTLVGKGVCFDTGGLNIKPGASMGLMKKDMGGAATVLGLAHMIMGLNLPLRLRVLIPAVENAIGGSAFRPQDILTARNGLTVEINNTDAEGRLVLADALAFAAEDASDMTISMATLTGAARVAVGPDLAPYFTDDDAVSQSLQAAGQSVGDPVWRLPFWTPYEPMIEPGIADLDNAPRGGFGGAITAALFLRRFASAEARYTHFDVYGWQPVAAPARPKGGVGQGARAILEALPALLDL